MLKSLFRGLWHRLFPTEEQMLERGKNFAIRYLLENGDNLRSRAHLQAMAYNSNCFGEGAEYRAFDAGIQKVLNRGNT